MDGLARVSGAGAPFCLGGRTWLVSPLRLRHWGEIEQYLLFTRPSNPLGDAGRSINLLGERGQDDLARHLLDKVRQDLRADRSARVVRFQEVLSWISTADGVVYTAWCCLRECGNPEFLSLEGVRDAVLSLNHNHLLEFVRLRDQVSGIDLIANSDWPDPFSGVRQEKRAARVEAMLRQYAPWRKNFYSVWQDTGAMPRDVGELTLYQYHLLLTDPRDLGLDSPDAASGRRGTASVEGSS